MIRSLYRTNTFLPGWGVTDDVDALAANSAACYMFCLTNEAAVFFNPNKKLRCGDLLLHLFYIRRLRLLSIQLSPWEGEPRKDWN